jgi:hypothetical protein
MRPLVAAMMLQIQVYQVIDFTIELRAVDGGAGLGDGKTPSHSSSIDHGPSNSFFGD